MWAPLAFAIYVPIILFGLILIDLTSVKIEDKDLLSSKETLQKGLIKQRRNLKDKSTTKPPTHDAIQDTIHELEIVLKAQTIDPDDPEIISKYLSDGDNQIVSFSKPKVKCSKVKRSLDSDSKAKSNKGSGDDDDEEDEDDDDEEGKDEEDTGNNDESDCGDDDTTAGDAASDSDDNTGDSVTSTDDDGEGLTAKHVRHFEGEGFDMLNDINILSKRSKNNFDLVNDALFASQLPWLKAPGDVASTPNTADGATGMLPNAVAGASVVALPGQTEAPKIKVEPGTAALRWINREKKQPPAEFQEFVQELRQRTYAHISKYMDVERKLKELGYKQSTKNAKKLPAIVGYDGDSCPKFVPSDPQISFCTQYLPAYREQEQQTLLYMYEHARREKMNIHVDEFFPLTWRLYKQAERRALRSRASNESLPQEGGPYVTKYTFSHNAGIPSLTVKIWDYLKKSDHSEKMQVQEAKQKIIVQQYINKPYLFQARKFIIRTWAVIISAKPLVVLYHDGALLRSIPPYSSFVKRDGNYKRAAHFTNAQSTNKGTLRSSSLYASLAQFQQWLNDRNQESKDFVQNYLLPKIKARMIYSLYAMIRPPKEVVGERADLKKSPALPASVVVLQPICFDFLLDENRKVWMLGVATGFCQVNLGGEGFKPTWKTDLQKAVADGLVSLSEELLWRKVKKTPLNTEELFTDIGMEMLIDETLPGWDPVSEINHLAKGRPLSNDGDDGSMENPDGVPSENVDDDGGSGDGSDEGEEEKPRAKNPANRISIEEDEDDFGGGDEDD